MVPTLALPSVSHASSRNSWGRMRRSWALGQQLLAIGSARLGAPEIECPDGAAAVDDLNPGHVLQTTAVSACVVIRSRWGFGGPPSDTEHTFCPGHCDHASC